MSPENSHSVVISQNDGLLFNPDDEILLNWSPELLMAPAIYADIDNEPVRLVDIGIFLHFYRFDMDIFELLQLNVIQNTANDGEEKIKVQVYIPGLRCTSLVGNELNFKVCTLLFRISVSYLQELPPGIGIWSGVTFLKPNSSTSDDELAEQCEKWSDSTQNRGLLALLDTLPPCPPLLVFAFFDINYQRENMVSHNTRDEEYHKTFMKYFHPNISVCYRQSM